MAQIFNNLDEVANEIKNILEFTSEELRIQDQFNQLENIINDISKTEKNKIAQITGIINRCRQNNIKKLLIYGFNATGKTRLSMIFKNLVNSNDERKKLIYFNAFTEDLFYWDNDELVMKFDAQSQFIKIIETQGKDQRLLEIFQDYSNSKIEPKINFNEQKIIFKLDSLQNSQPIKISRGEESLFIWCVFHIILETIVDELSLREEDRSTSEFNDLEYIYIDDPISSLDDNHCINLAIGIHKLIKTLNNDKLRIIISTHHPLFYNLLCRNMGRNNCKKYILKKISNGFEFKNLSNTSSFSYHIYLKNQIELAITNNDISRIHFNMFRQLLENTAIFLNYDHWSYCINRENRSEFKTQLDEYSHNRRNEPETIDINENLKNQFVERFENFKNKFLPDYES